VELVEAVWRQATFEIGFCPLIHKDLNLCVAFAHSPLTLSHSPSDAACCVCVPLCVCQCVRNRQDTTVLRRLSGLCWVVLCCVCWVVFGVLAILDWRLGVRRDSGLWTKAPKLCSCMGVCKCSTGVGIGGGIGILTLA
jgi:hypothetical protein